MSATIKPVRGKEFPRNFTAHITDFGDWAQLESLFEKLEAQGKALKSVQDMEAWILNQSEMGAALNEEYARRYIAMTCNTEDEAIEKAYLHYIENIHPKTKVWDETSTQASPPRLGQTRAPYAQPVTRSAEARRATRESCWRTDIF